MTIMVAQDNVALARSLVDLYNSHQSDPAWLDKSVAAFAADSTLTVVPSGRMFPGSDGYKQLVLFFVDSFPESSVELTNAFATEDQLVIEFTGRGTNTGPLHLPTGDVPATGRYSELRFCEVIQCRNGKIVSFHIYYDNMTLLQNLGLVPAMG
jgi:predicted ester cyclase